ncbi:MAG: hypothetical protein LIP01_14325 [Tannerellaceae bacterium]|nr:hypothetical protein [Tannerellaceae bacterium]
MYGTSTRRWFKAYPLPEQNRKRGNLLVQWPALQRDRFRAVNLQEPENHACGIFRWLAAVHGQEETCHMPVAAFLSHYHLRLLDDEVFFKRYKYKLQIDILHTQEEDWMEHVPLHPVRFREKDFQTLYIQLHILWHNILYESFLIYGTNIRNYRISRKWGQGYLLLFRIPGQHEWICLGQFFEKEHLIHVANLFCSFLCSITHRCMPGYIVEHLLYADKSDDEEEKRRLTFIFPRFAKAVYRKEHIEMLIRERIPTHQQAGFLWLKVKDMTDFERLYYSWRKAWSNSDRDLDRLSNELKMYLSGWKIKNERRQ